MTALTPCLTCGLGGDVTAAAMTWWAIDMRHGVEWQAQSVDWTGAHSGASRRCLRALRIVAAVLVEAAPWLPCFAPVPGHEPSSSLRPSIFCRRARHGRVGAQTGRSPAVRCQDRRSDDVVVSNEASSIILNSCHHDTRLTVLFPWSP